MFVLNRLALLPALALLLFTAAQEGTANRLLSDSAPDAAAAHAPGSPALCANPIATYTVKSGDTPKLVVTAAYPTSAVPWRKLWGIIKACNTAAARSNGKPSSSSLLTAGTTLSIPAVPADLTKVVQSRPGDDNPKPEDPVLKLLCGCTADITVTNPSTWIEVVTAAYPDVKPVAGFAANILKMCNRGAKFVDGSDKSTLAADQKLRGLCLTIQGKSYADFLNDAHQQADRVEAELAASQVSGAAASDGVSVAQTTGTCAINTALSTAAVRTVFLSNTCPVYTNGCSGPSDILSYQAQLTPCCQTHDWCYSCAYTVGWTGSAGRNNCDSYFLNNLHRACDYWYPSDVINGAACKTTADSMYATVSVGGASYFNNNDVCPGESWKLPNVAFCFNPVYTLDASNRVVQYIRPGNGQQWGSWTNYAQCPVGSWVNAFALRMQTSQGYFGDDTALNAVKVSCAAADGTQSATELLPEGGGGNYGGWTGYYACPAGKHVTAVRMQVEGSQGAGDDTAANNVQAKCSDGSVLAPSGSNWGNWGSWSNWVTCPAGTAVCAFEIKIEQAGAVDCTSMNDLEVACCAKD